MRLLYRFASGLIFLAVLLASGRFANACRLDLERALRFVTMDPQRRVIENGAVAVAGDHIVDAGPRAEIDNRYRAQQRIDRPDAIPRARAY